LERLVTEGASERRIASHLGVGHTTVRRWLARYGLVTARARRLRAGATVGSGDGKYVELPCPRHGLTTFVVRSDGGGRRCLKCRSAAVSRRRRRVKQLLVEEAGGACAHCGYDRCVAALAFHHVDPAGKAFTISMQGLTRSLEKARQEAKKCVLLCSNCHAEVEAGFTDLRDRVRVPITRGESVPG
jgi:hypothetical protein